MSLYCWILESRYLSIPLTDWFSTSKHVLQDRCPFYIVYAWTNYRQPTFMAACYLFAMVFGLYFWKTKAEFRPSIFELILFAAAGFVVIITTQSRLGFVLFVLIILVFYLSLLSKNKKLLIINCSLLVVCIVLFSAFFHQKLYSIFSDATRQQIYDTALFYAKHNALTGCGLGSMPEIYRSNEIAQTLGYDASFWAHHAHNQFIGDFMQTGIIGLLLIFAISIYLIYFSIKNKNWFLLSFFVLYLIFMQIEMPLYFKNGGVTFILFIFLLKDS
jgi:O-antigen ligase